MNVAILSNSYGEDRSGALIAKELKSMNKDIKINAFPLISFGEEYERRNFKVIGGHNPPPSGGFLFKSVKNFFADITETFSLPFSYIDNLRKFRKTTDFLIVVGDIPLLVLGYISMRKKAYFIALCKSSYISPHFALERFLMRKATEKVFTHDKITAEYLQKSGINAEFFGNPMMDDLSGDGKPFVPRGEILIGLLPGSRKEAYKNMSKIGAVVKEILQTKKNLHFAVALSHTVDKNKMMESVPELRHRIDFLYGRFVDIVKGSRIVISLGGTASEQALYLKTPVISFPGSGAQNTKRRLKGQKKLLGDAFILLNFKPKKIAKKILEVLENKDLTEELKAKGKKRAGKSGGARKIARYIYNKEVETKKTSRESRSQNTELRSPLTLKN
jgi:tetraacyldisaccharide 4'-kinase